jgi:hypothetical protein
MSSGGEHASTLQHLGQVGQVLDRYEDFGGAGCLPTRMLALPPEPGVPVPARGNPAGVVEAGRADLRRRQANRGGQFAPGTARPEPRQ